MTDTPDPHPEPITDPEEAEEHLGERAKHLAAEAGRELLDKANTTGKQGLRSMGRKLDHAADYIRDRAPEAASKFHVEGRHVEAVADRIEGAASYLKERDPKSLLADIDASIQKHPYRALAVGAAVGWIIGRLSRRS